MSMIELTGDAIRAVPYRKRRAMKPVELPSGAIVKSLASGHRGRLPFELPVHHEASPGRFVRLTGTCVLSTGDVAIVYGAKAETIG